MNSLLFPDVNVWVALNYEHHAHHPAANRWYQALPLDARLAFCRQTQMGLFRILTTAAVMGTAILTQEGCWRLFDRWRGTGQVFWVDEPGLLETPLRARTHGSSSSPKVWMDAYLAAFAETAGLTLVTFDRALAEKARGAVLLARD